MCIGDRGGAMNSDRDQEEASGQESLPWRLLGSCCSIRHFGAAGGGDLVVVRGEGGWG